MYLIKIIRKRVAVHVLDLKHQNADITLSTRKFNLSILMVYFLKN